MRSRAILSACLLIAFFAGVGIAQAAKPAGRAAVPDAKANTAEAARLVKGALEAEALGRGETRAALLKQAVAADLSCAAAHWHLGEVLVGDQWLSIEVAAQRAARDGKIFEYNNRRNSAGGSAEEQLELARWCREQGLSEQHRAHALFALAMQPGLPEARAELGLRPQNGFWLTPGELVAREKQQRQVKDAFKRWKAQLTRWLKDSKSKQQEVRELANSKLRGLDDPSAIPALEQFLSVESSESALLVVAALSNMKEQTATESLVRHAVLSPWDDVRRAAAESLQTRSVYSYAPLLLAGLQSPIEVQVSFSEEGFGTWRYRCALFREGPMADMVADLQVKVQPVRQPILNRPPPGSYDVRTVRVPDQEEGFAKAQSLSEGNFGVSTSAIASTNARASQLNARIGQALETATRGTGAGNVVPATDVAQPRYWWKWWSDHNELYYPEERPLDESFYQYQSTYQPVTSVTRVDPPKPVSLSVPGRTRTRSCFLAGTPVWTPTGPISIELAQPGDLVLAQQIETGELRYKAVLETTVRPPSPMIRVRTGDKELVLTRGHPLWVSGKGWRMGKELAVGELLHTATGPVEITAIEPGPKEAAYNLVVDEFNTYCVGPDRVLAHDNNLRQPTDVVVPGLAGQP